MGKEGITNLLELGLDGEGLEEDNEDAFFNEGSSLGVGDGLLDGGETDVAVTAGCPENHAFKANLERWRWGGVRMNVSTIICCATAKIQTHLLLSGDNSRN